MRSKAEKLTAQAAARFIQAYQPGSAYEGEWGPRDLLEPLEYFIPELISNEHSEFTESLDGLFPDIVKRAGERKLEIIGSALMMNDQTLTAMHVLIELTDNDEPEPRIHRICCRLGEKDENSGSILRVPYSFNSARKQPASIRKRLKEMEWVYEVDRS